MTDQISFTPDELRAIKSVYAPSATQEQFDVWLAHCKQRNLVPGQDVLLQIRFSNEWDPNVRAKVRKANLVLVTTISALRKIAERTGKYGGPQPPEWVYLDSNGQPTVTSKVPLPTAAKTAPDNPLGPTFLTPWAAMAWVYREGWKEPVQGIARFGAYAQTYTADGDDGKKTYLNQTWRTRGPEQLAKCAQAAAFREAFPEISGLYIEEELSNDPEKVIEESKVVTPQATTTAAAPAPIVAPAINQAPVAPKQDTRPENGQQPAAVSPLTEELGKALATKPVPNLSTGVPEKSTPVDPRITEGLKRLADENQVKAQVSAFVDTLVPENDPKQADPVVPVQAEPAKPEPDLADPLTEISNAAQDQEVPSKEELKKYGDNLKARKLDSDTLKVWLLKLTGATIIKKITRGQWKAAIEKLDAVTELGQAAVEGLLKTVTV